MRPRVVFRTHYQVDEPAYMEIVVKECTSAVQSAYDESVAQRLAKAIKQRDKGFNVAAGGYALDLAHALGILSEQNVWTDKGHLVNLVADVGSNDIDKELELTGSERLLHFRLFLEADGAALLFIARHLLEHDNVPNGGSDGWNRLASSLFVEVLASYLRVASTTKDRVELRTELDRIKSRGYKGKSGNHKMFIHLQALHRLGLVERATSGNGRSYGLASDQQRESLASLVEMIPDMYALERVVTSNDWARVAGRVFRRSESEIEHIDPEKSLELIVPFYKRVVATGTAMCHLSTVFDAVQIQLMTTRSELLPYQVALDSLQAAQRSSPGDIRFHVDRRGRPAFLKLSDAALRGAQSA